MTARARHLRPDPIGRRLLRAAATVVQVAVVAVALAVIALPLATDYQWRTVVSGSMRPVIHPGDVILTAPMAKPLEVGDVVTFVDPIHGDGEVVHRVVGFDGEGMVLTKGDANDAVDPWALHPAEISRGVVFRVPKAGFLVEWMSSKAGIVVFLFLPSIVILVSEARVWYRFVRYGEEAFRPSAHGRHLGAPA
ncbi:MAG: signal peptidase I [Actinomycetes bacterium]|jgi:signal peptidase|nr:signal peptidase I [Acidimicrobiia bacterium]